TFNELYAHRVRLFSSLMHAYAELSWWSRKHSDGEEWDGWIIAWICPYISRHLSSLNPLLARCRRYSRGER
ncbi:WDGH domain-containing protein, partial [Escherichia coli]|uniref:WDGH domain-containing protein n=1 Tax=Escherichia coli TaxID=562 RepID=UPI004037ED71